MDDRIGSVSLSSNNTLDWKKKKLKKRAKNFFWHKQKKVTGVVLTKLRIDLGHINWNFFFVVLITRVKRGQPIVLSTVQTLKHNEMNKFDK